MGVLVPGGDRTAVRRTAEFFLKNFEVGLQPRCPPCHSPLHTCALTQTAAMFAAGIPRCLH